MPTNRTRRTYAQARAMRKRGDVKAAARARNATYKDLYGSEGHAAARYYSQRDFQDTLYAGERVRRANRKRVKHNFSFFRWLLKGSG